VRVKAKVLAIAFVAGLALTSGTAAAQSGRGPLFLSPMGEPFRADGATPPIAVWFAAADQDADGRLSRDEFVGQAMGFFRTTLDANGDGGVTTLESAALWRAEAPEMFALRPMTAAQERPRHRTGGTPNPRDRRESRAAHQASRSAPTPMAHFALFDIAEPVMSCDADISRRVTEDEFAACAARRFALLDEDGDGFFALQDNPRALALLGSPGS